MKLHQGAEALGQLKPQESRALVLTAEGYSYREICAITAGPTRTSVWAGCSLGSSGGTRVR